MTETTNNKLSRAITNSSHVKYLTFKIAIQEFGVNILRVKEIISMIDITPIPQTPQFVKGIINLRGQIIPVVDLRMKLGYTEIEYDDRSCIIVVEIESEKSKTLMSIVVDYISEVISMMEENISSPPDFGGTYNADYIEGIAKLDEKVVILLNIQKIFAGEEIIRVMQTINNNEEGEQG